MKLIKTTLAALLVTAAIMHCVSCKKGSTTPTPKTTQEKLLGKWNLISVIDNDYYGGSPHITTYNYPPGAYIEFRNDGRATTYDSGSTTNYDYGVITDSRIWMPLPSYIYELKIFTDTDLQLYRKEVTGADYHEYTLNLKR